MGNRNLILATDGYKPSHFLQYPPGTQGLYAYVAARKTGMLLLDGTVVYAGLQPFIYDYLSKPITRADIGEAEDILVPYGVPFNRAGWEYILNAHDGFLPVRIRAVEEGSRLAPNVPMVTVESTDKAVPWVVSYIESPLLRSIWYMSTVATVSKAIKSVILAFLQENGDPSGIHFKLHDFGSRGVSSSESAKLGGIAHLFNFLGTDTLEALKGARDLYGADLPCAFSIPASEHSTITSWGRDGELAAFSNMVDQFGKRGATFACVSDSYNIMDAVSHLWGTELRQKVIDSGATLVVRPDSGKIVPTVLEVMERLDAAFGHTLNSKGYKVLNHVRVIQGDGIDGPNVVYEVLSNMGVRGYSADNIAFGMGGGLLQHPNRDTLGFAMKTSAVNVNGQWHDVYKDPVGGGKKSLAGLVEARYEGDKIALARRMDGWTDKGTVAMHTFFDTGSIPRSTNLESVRERLGW